MYIIIYVVAICLIGAGAIAIFVIKDRQNKKRGELLKKQSQQENQQFIGTDYSLPGENTKDGKEEKQDETQLEQATFEDYPMAQLESELPKEEEHETQNDNEPKKDGFMFDDEFDDEEEEF